MENRERKLIIRYSKPFSEQTKPHDFFFPAEDKLCFADTIVGVFEDAKNCRFHFLLNKSNERSDYQGNFVPTTNYKLYMVKPVSSQIKKILIYYSNIDSSLIGFRFINA